MESRSKAYEYIEQIRKVNTDAEFETNYLQMQESAEEAISYGLVE